MKNKIAKLLFLIASLSISFLLAEGILRYRESCERAQYRWFVRGGNVNALAGRRVSDFAKISTFNGCLIDRGIVIEDKVLGYRNVPDTEGYMIHVDDRPNLVVKKDQRLSFAADAPAHTTTAFRINRDGNRGPEMRTPKPADTFRIVFIGDSVTFGYYTNEVGTFSGITRRLLSDKQIDGRRIEIVNAGVTSLGAKEVLAHIKHRIVDWSPDLVVWGFYLNDVTENEADVIFPVRDLGVWSFLGRSAAGRLAERRIFSTRWGSTLNLDPKSKTNQKVNRAWEKVRAEIAEGKQLLASKNIKLALISFPNGIQLGRRWTTFYYQSRLKAICDRLSIPFLDTLPILEAEGRTDDLYFKTDLIHPNAQGHRVIGNAVSEFILRIFPESIPAS